MAALGQQVLNLYDYRVFISRIQERIFISIANGPNVGVPLPPLEFFKDLITNFLKDESYVIIRTGVKYALEFGLRAELFVAELGLVAQKQHIILIVDYIHCIKMGIFMFVRELV